ncbi:sensor histidine kinase [bacterium 1XD42-54]|nr:sensor histidine kinase [bacterium 1XD42-54]
MIMKGKMRIHSIRQRLLFFGGMLCMLLLLFFSFFWKNSQYLFRQQSRLLEVQRTFASLVNGLEESDSRLYSYALDRDDDIKIRCTALLQEMREAGQALAGLLDAPIFTDLEYLIADYADCAGKVLEETNGGTGGYLALYQATKERMELIHKMMNQHQKAVNQDRVEWQARLEATQKNVERTLLGGTAVLIVFCMAFLVRFSKGVTRRLTLLTGCAEKICEGEWVVDMPPEAEAGHDEVWVLSRAFYRMLDEILDQIEELKLKEAMERQLKEAEVRETQMTAKLERAKLLTLQSRVNPHFLFNALNVIGGQAAAESAPKTMDMIFETADYLRYSLSRLGKTVTLQEEMQNVENYLSIQKRRFADRLQYEIREEAECGQIWIPSMILQPLCENALIHGIMPVAQGGRILIDAVWDKKRVRITVADNGTGFTPERLAQVQKDMADENYDDTNGIGLSNILRRLNVFFEEPVDYTIESEPGKETKVSLWIPARTRDAMEEKDANGAGSTCG